mgnify:CR=1 FL=1
MRRNLTFGLMFLVAILSYVDRQIFTLFQDDIKLELGLNDGQLGLLTGMSFALFYAIAAFPIARYADRGDRRLVVALCVMVWSAATALCGVANSFWQMVLARIGLAAGEAGAGPASISLLTEIFPPERRTIVISSMLAASAIGISAGLWLAGWLSQFFNWREVFLIVGLPGILIGLAVWLFSAEPRRGKGDVVVPPQQIGMAEVMEAYAVQAMACVTGAALPPGIVNIGGGALARGHPIGASGAILAVRLFQGLREGFGLAAIAAAGGLGSALVVARSGA